MSDFKSYTRGEDSDQPRSGKDSAVRKELAKLFQAGTTNDHKVLSDLRHKYKDDVLINDIFDQYKERLNYISQRARKFKQKMFDRYSGRNLSKLELLRKAKKFQKKAGLNDDEFSMFETLLYTERSGMESSLSKLPTTKMSRTLGYSPSVLSASDKLNVSAKEQGVVQKILEMYATTKSIHSQVVLQSITYQDCAPEALLGKFGYDKAAQNRYSYVHPVVAALFLPRINHLDEHMLVANIGYIVQCKQKGTPIMTKPDFELYNDLIRDPNDSACNMDSAIKDLHNRYELQTRLWDSVLNLRQGRYYAPGLSGFLTAIDNCRSNVYDAPDLTYVKDEGTILRRLLSAFSLRPTIISTTRMWGMFGTNNQGFSSDPMSAMGIGQLTTVPMVTLRLPLNISGRNAKAVDIQEALTQPQWFVENKMIVPKSQQIVHSRDVLFFYVGRRFQTINISRVNTPCNFNALPMTVAGWEALNDMTVNYSDTINILEDTFKLRSVVVVDQSKDKNKLIIGSSTMVVTNDHTRILYDPQGAGEMFPDAAGTGLQQNDPITEIPAQAPFNVGSGVESFYERASTRGTVFMYQKVTSGRGNLSCGC